MFCSDRKVGLIGKGGFVCANALATVASPPPPSSSPAVHKIFSIKATSTQFGSHPIFQDFKMLSKKMIWLSKIQIYHEFHEMFAIMFATPDVF